MKKEFNLSEKIQDNGRYKWIYPEDVKEFIRLIIKDIRNVVNFEDYQKKWLINNIKSKAGDKLKEDKGK